MDKDLLKNVIDKINGSGNALALTGAGISKASGIPPFRGSDGIWSKYDPRLLDIDFFKGNPEKSWRFMAETFFSFFESARPNAAHLALAEMERKGRLRGVITQNIDTLHQQAGSRKVMEFHGGLDRVICLSCGKTTPFEPRILNDIPPRCEECGGLLKPDVVFFGEAIPAEALSEVDKALAGTDLLLVIGTSAEVYPASFIPGNAKSEGALIVEINPYPSTLTGSVTDIFVPARAEDFLPELAKQL
jgi:NAD-dependent deacetylase